MCVVCVCVCACVFVCMCVCMCVCVYVCVHEMNLTITIIQYYTGLFLSMNIV